MAFYSAYAKSRTGGIHTWKPSRMVSTKANTQRRGATKGTLTNRQRRIVRKMITASKELNYYNYTVATGTDVTTTAALSSIVVPTQGDGESQRINDKIEPTSLKFKCHVRSNTSTHGAVRYIIFRWKPDNAVDTPNGSKILAGDDMSHYVADQTTRKKFEVLWDGYFTLSSATASPIFHRYIEKVIDISSKPIYFNEAGTTGKNMIYFMRVSNSAGTNDIEHEVQIRSHYRDA